MKRCIAAVLLVFVTVSTRQVLGFGNDGHKIVCAIGFLLLETKEQTEVTRLTRVYKRPDGQRYNFYTQACTFPDVARSMAREGTPGWTFFSRFDNWHFLNVPRDTKTVDTAHCGDDCVLKGSTTTRDGWRTRAWRNGSGPRPCSFSATGSATSTSRCT